MFAEATEQDGVWKLTDPGANVKREGLNGG